MAGEKEENRSQSPIGTAHIPSVFRLMASVQDAPIAEWTEYPSLPLLKHPLHVERACPEWRIVSSVQGRLAGSHLDFFNPSLYFFFPVVRFPLVKN